MENIEEITKQIENLYEEFDEIKTIIKILNNEVQSANNELYKLAQEIKKETTGH